MKKPLQIQSPSTVVMVVPHHFRINPETALDNHFQHAPTSSKIKKVDAQQARAEVEAVVSQLQHAGVRVIRFDDEGTEMPDSVFPNNWFSTHADGKLLIYPMYCCNRQKEIRQDIIDTLQAQFHVKELIDLRAVANPNEALEGTGSMVFDHLHQRIYACRSARTSERLLQLVANSLSYQPVLFDAYDEQQHAIYHTNVMMGIGTQLAMIGSANISPLSRRNQVLQTLRSERQLIELNPFQLSQFAGNSYELCVGDQALLAISSRAWKCLDAQQRRIVQSWCVPLICELPSIEAAGGSIRCMLAGIYLESKPRF